MERLNPDLYSDAQMRAGTLIEDDLENILLAWRWYIENGVGDGLLQMMDSLHEFCDRSRLCLSDATAFRQASQALGSMSEPNRIRPGLRGALSIYDGLLSQRIGSTVKPALDGAQYQTETIHAHLRQTLNSTAAADMTEGAQDHAEELLIDSLAMARTLGNIFDQAMALALLGETKLAQDQPVEAGKLLDGALHLVDQSGAAPLALQIVSVVAQRHVCRQTDQLNKATALLRYVVDYPATEADIRSSAEECLSEFDTRDTVEDLSGQDIWRVVADLRSGPLLQITAKS